MIYEGKNLIGVVCLINHRSDCRRCGPTVYAIGTRRLADRKARVADPTPDKGGHRAKAIALVNNAIAEVNAGIAYARRHNHAVSGDMETIFAAASDQPHMQAALTALESARNNLDRAEADKGGHRAKAIDLVKSAIDEVKLGIQAGRG